MARAVNMASCLRTLVKHLLFLFNLIFTIVGLAIIGAGSYALHYVTTLKYLLATEQISVINIDNLKYAFIGIIVLGIVIFLISFCGCCGSITETKCMIVHYAIMMFLLGGASIYLLIAKDGYYDTAKNWINNGLYHTFYEADYPFQDKTINDIQYTANCCGSYGPGFYKETKFNMKGEDIDQDKLRMIEENLYVSGMGIISPSCCSTFNWESFLGDQVMYLLYEYKCTAKEVYQKGCLPKMKDYVDMILKYLTYTVGGIAATTVTTFLLAIFLISTMRSKRESLSLYIIKQ